MYEKHVFVCANEKPSPKKCCGAAHGQALVDAMRECFAQQGASAKIRIQKAGCLDLCGKGPCMVVYPEGVFYGNVQLEDVEELVKSHLLEGKIVNRLQIG